MRPILTPPAIKPGDTLAVVAPASSPKPDELEPAIASLESGGYRVKRYRPLCEPVGFLSGTDKDRADDLMQAFTDPEVSGVIAARGGYGVARLLDLLDYEVIRQNPKVLAGYSDITALHVALMQRAGLVTFHSPNVVDGLFGGGKADIPTREAFWRVVSRSEAPYTLTDGAWGQNLTTLAPGVAEGRLIGGNLAVFCGLIGTSFEPDTTGRVLFLEDLDEAPYRVDRMLRQLKLAGKLDRLAGVVLGHFTNCGPRGDAPSLTLDQLFEEYFGGLRVPVIAGFPAGHDLPNVTLPHGAVVRVDAGDRKLTIISE